MKFRTVRSKLLALTLPISLLPLIGISAFTYNQAKSRITQDRVALFLEQLAQDTSDKILLKLQEQREDTDDIATNPWLIEALDRKAGEPASPQVEAFLNKEVLIHDVIDLILILDPGGKILQINSIDDDGRPIPAATRLRIVGRQIQAFPEEMKWFEKAARGIPAFRDWYRSPLVDQFHSHEGEDISRSFKLAFAAPVISAGSRRVIGVLCTILHWEFIQNNILDLVEEDLKRKGLTTGYAFLFARDGDTIIGHKYRKNRKTDGKESGPASGNNYGTTLTGTHGLHNLHRSVLAGAKSAIYEYPQGVPKISGLAKVDFEDFGWTVGVGINSAQIFAPVEALKWVMIAATAVTITIIVFFSWAVSRQITHPLQQIASSASEIARGRLSTRVLVRSTDEVGLLAESFNTMAEAVESRSRELTNLNITLDQRVEERTRELQATLEALERANGELKGAYQDLKDTQARLLQAKNMASLGRLVAGLAHEINNPLNFIYGNTGFLRQHIKTLTSLIETLEDRPVSPAKTGENEELKAQIGYEFALSEIDSLLDNFDEGARRIHSIVSDIRTFSSFDPSAEKFADVNALLDRAIEQVSPDWRGRIMIHKAYTADPRIQCYPEKLGRVFLHLLSNAIKAIHAKGNIWVETARNNDTLSVRIRDNGVGIPKDNLDKIFDPFFTTREVGQGTGLGLTVCYGVVEQHRGTIRVESEAGSGTSVTVILPGSSSR